MKKPFKDKTIRTTPKGAWEGGIINDTGHNHKTAKPDEITTDMQGNGYPISKAAHANIISDYRHK